MDLKDLTTTVFYRSLFDAAERFYEKDPATALEIYRAYFRYAFGETDEVETDNVVAELLVKQNVPSLDAATNRYLAACNNGPKGKENGGGVGRPRKGESQEEYQKRVAEWKKNKEKNPEKTPEQTPEETPEETPEGIEEENNPVKTGVIEKSVPETSQNPEKPLTKAISNSYSKSNSYSYSKDTSSSKENNNIYIYDEMDITNNIIEEKDYFFKEERNCIDIDYNISKEEKYNTTQPPCSPQELLNIYNSSFNEMTNLYPDLNYNLVLTEDYDGFEEAYNDIVKEYCNRIKEKSHYPAILPIGFMKMLNKYLINNQYEEKTNQR